MQRLLPASSTSLNWISTVLAPCLDLRSSSMDGTDWIPSLKDRGSVLACVWVRRTYLISSSLTEVHSSLSYLRNEGHVDPAHQTIRVPPCRRPCRPGCDNVFFHSAAICSGSQGRWYCYSAESEGTAIVRSSPVRLEGNVFGITLFVHYLAIHQCRCALFLCSNSKQVRRLSFTQLAVIQPRPRNKVQETRIIQRIGNRIKVSAWGTSAQR